MLDRSWPLYLCLKVFCERKMVSKMNTLLTAGSSHSLQRVHKPQPSSLLDQVRFISETINRNQLDVITFEIRGVLTTNTIQTEEQAARRAKKRVDKQIDIWMYRQYYKQSSRQVHRPINRKVDAQRTNGQTVMFRSSSKLSSDQGPAYEYIIN